MFSASFFGKWFFAENYFSGNDGEGQQQPQPYVAGSSAGGGYRRPRSHSIEDLLYHLGLLVQEFDDLDGEITSNVQKKYDKILSDISSIEQAIAESEAGIATAKSIVERIERTEARIERLRVAAHDQRQAEIREKAALQSRHEEALAKTKKQRQAKQMAAVIALLVAA